jgi:heme oxygenase
MTTATPFLARLKDATRPHHEATEKTVDLGHRAETLDGYRGLLGRFLGFYEPAEARLAPVLGAMPALDFEARRKTELLKADLRTLGLGDDAIAALPRYAGFPPPTDLTDALGSMYVLEGATLGGQYVAKHVATALGVRPGEGCSFFNSYGENVGPMWKAFKEVLSDAAESETEQDRVIASAGDTFDRFNDWFLAFPR